MEIRSYRKGDEKEIMDLDARVLPSIWNRRTLANWYWKYTDANPAGPSFIRLACHNGKIVAHFAAVPYRLKTFAGEVTASHSIGALVEEKYQNRGVLKLVGDKLMADLVEHHIPYTWGFPNRRAYRFEKEALGYEDLINFDEWQCPKEKLYREEPPLSFRKVTFFDRDYDRLWEECSPGYAIAVKRDHTYLNWRFIQRPDWWYFPYAVYRQNRLTGYVVLKLYREDDILKGHVVDIFCKRDDEETISQLLAGSIDFFAEQGADMATTWLWGSPTIEQVLSTKGFVKQPTDRPLILRVNIREKNRREILDKAHWYFTMGDSTEIF
jgi:hypothetical protein